MRGNRPFLFTNLKDKTGLPAVVAWLCSYVGMRLFQAEDRVSNH
jgi:hypothetical protein